jgi:hypothetical protein
MESSFARLSRRSRWIGVWPAAGAATSRSSSAAGRSSRLEARQGAVAGAGPVVSASVPRCHGAQTISRRWRRTATVLARRPDGAAGCQAAHQPSVGQPGELEHGAGQQPVYGPGRQQRQHRADDAGDHALEEERPADERVRAPTSCMITISSRRAKMAMRMAAPMMSAATAAKPSTQCQRRGGRHAAQHEYLVQPVGAVADLLDQRDLGHDVGNGADGGGVALPREQRDLQRRRQRVRLDAAEDRAQLLELAAGDVAVPPPGRRNARCARRPASRSACALGHGCGAASSRRYATTSTRASTSRTTCRTLCAARPNRPDHEQRQRNHGCRQTVSTGDRRNAASASRSAYIRLLLPARNRRRRGPAPVPPPAAMDCAGPAPGCAWRTARQCPMH